MLKAGLLALLTSAAAVAPALAWDDQGHMMVAAVAYDKLTPPTKARIAALLALSQYPTSGVNNASAANQEKAKFMMAATAADAIKKDGRTFHNDGEDPTAAPDASRNTGFDDKNMHKYWHYIESNLEFLASQLARLPTRAYLCRMLLLATASIWALLAILLLR